MFLLYRVGQQRDGTGALDGLGQLALMLGAVAGHTAGQDFAALVDVAVQTAGVLIIDIFDLADAEVAHLAARTAAGAAMRTGFPFAAIFRHMYILLHSESERQFLFIDLDNMKAINDRHGHEMGDQALKDTAKLLRSVCSSEAFIMRYGGDEFILIDTGRDEALPDKILAAVKEYNRTSGMPFTLGLSLGVVRSDAAERRPIDDCIKAADSLMYEIKEKKKTGRR